jgi:hypothetical protein
MYGLREERVCKNNEKVRKIDSEESEERVVVIAEILMKGEIS